MYYVIYMLNFKKEIIPCQNTKNGKIYERSFQEVKEMVLKKKDYKIKYKNFELHIFLQTGYYSGYITKFDNKLKKYFKKDELNFLSEIEGIYKIHGDFTHSSGFNCAHIDDIFIGFTTKYNGRTFKTHKFVESELKKTVNSIIKISKISKKSKISN
jgi:hypothetical protein